MTSVRDPVGFPAHAGMDPAHQGLHDRAAGFPRPRGDGPLLIGEAHQHQRVSPPTRGWTVACPGHPRQACGFPAHAGMDPNELGRSRPDRRFPRPRGDGPMPPEAQWYIDGVSPPTRGWTHASECRRTGKGGFPAHAGMDLLPWRAPPGRSGFPRPRGDGPYYCGKNARGRWVSPPTRGWTFLVIGLKKLGGGFPAHAGMDRSPTRQRPSVSWFPRPRGDGPMSEDVPAVSMEVSPPTRGWTA